MLKCTQLVIIPRWPPFFASLALSAHLCMQSRRWEKWKNGSSGIPSSAEITFLSNHLIMRGSGTASRVQQGTHKFHLFPKKKNGSARIRQFSTGWRGQIKLDAHSAVQVMKRALADQVHGLLLYLSLPCLRRYGRRAGPPRRKPISFDRTRWMHEWNWSNHFIIEKHTKEM